MSGGDAQPTVRLDHLVITALSLQEGEAWVSAHLGVAPGAHGRHATMGTHNALWGLGDCYLEVIAVDPDGAVPDRPRWFGLDDPAHLERLKAGPMLSTWAVSTDDIDALRTHAPVPLGETIALARDDLTWEIAMTDAAEWPLGGAWPLIIRWETGLHPAERLGDQGLSLAGLEISGRGADAALSGLHGLADGRVALRTGGGATALTATLETPTGRITL